TGLRSHNGHLPEPRIAPSSSSCCGPASARRSSRGGGNSRGSRRPHVPRVYESGIDEVFGATVAIVADEQIRAARAATREHHSLDERLARQLPQGEKAARATHVIINNGSVAKLQQELSEVLLKLDEVKPA